MTVLSRIMPIRTKAKLRESESARRAACERLLTSERRDAQRQAMAALVGQYNLVAITLGALSMRFCQPRRVRIPADVSFFPLPLLTPLQLDQAYPLFSFPSLLSLLSFINLFLTFFLSH